MRNSKLFFALILLTACQPVQKKEESGYIDFFNRIPGVWQLEKSTTFEEWEKDGDLYKATVYKPLGKESFVTEWIRILEINGEIFYEAKVRGQNGEKPVLFKLTKSDRDKVVFENKEHDFPSIISYQFLSDNVIQAFIQGIINGKPKKIEFRYNRIIDSPVI